MKAQLFALALVVFMPTISVGAAESKIGAFRVKKDADPINDADRSSIASVSVNESGVLGWTCREDGLNVLYVWNRYLMGKNDVIRVDHRFPSQPGVSKSWDLTSGHVGGYMPMSYVKTFTQQAKTAPSVVLRVVDSDGDVVTETFKLDGLAQALRTLPCAKSVSEGQ